LRGIYKVNMVALRAVRLSVSIALEVRKVIMQVLRGHAVCALGRHLFFFDFSEGPTSCSSVRETVD